MEKKCSKCNEEFEFTNPNLLKGHIVFVSCYECGDKKSSKDELTKKLCWLCRIHCFKCEEYFCLDCKEYCGDCRQDFCKSCLNIHRQYWNSDWDYYEDYRTDCTDFLEKLQKEDN